MNWKKQDGTAKKPEPLALQGGQTMRFEEVSSERKESGQPKNQSPKKAFLTVIRSRADIGVHAEVESQVLIGRDPECTFPLHDYGVSWQHATITPCGEQQYMLNDLQSTNGTFINGAAITRPRMLRDGEKIFAGETVIRFSLADEMDIDFHSEVATLVGTDPLTGLQSKRRYDEALEYAILSAKAGNRSLAVLMMDMDGVKQINDTHGHLFGAHVIGETGRQIAKILGAKGHACRFGGDEFSAFLPTFDLDSACEAGEQIRQAIEGAGMEKDGIPLKPTISIGVACYPSAGEDLLQLVSNADQALYRAKDLGKNRVAT